MTRPLLKPETRIQRIGQGGLNKSHCDLSGQENTLVISIQLCNYLHEIPSVNSYQ